MLSPAYLRARTSSIKAVGYTISCMMSTREFIGWNTNIVIHIQDHQRIDLYQWQRKESRIPEDRGDHSKEKEKEIKIQI